MRRGFLLSICVVAFFLFVYSSVAFAGGSNIFMVALNTGVPKEKPVEVVITIFEPNKNKLDWTELTKYAYDPTKYTPIGVPDLYVKIDFLQPSSSQYCLTKDGGKTKEYGQVHASCYSNDPGQFVVQAVFLSDNPLHDGGPTAKGTTATVAILFEKPIVQYVSAKQDAQKATQAPSPKQLEQTNASAEATQQQLLDLQKQNEQQKQEIEELKSQQQKEEKKESFLQRVSAGIKSFFQSIFRKQ